MNTGNYFLPEGYRINPPLPYTMSEYWTPEQIRNAEYYQWDVYRFAVRWVRRHSLGSLCDVGCGPGVKLEKLYRELPGVSLWGMDQPEPIAWCRKKYGFGEWTEIDLSRPGEVPKRACDMLVCADVIEHLELPDNLMSLLGKLMKPAGYILLSTPDRDRLRFGDRRGPPLNETHIREWNRDELAAYIQSHGFKVLRHFHVAPVPFAFNRLWWDEVAWRWRHGKTARYNQVVLMTQ